MSYKGVDVRTLIKCGIPGSALTGRHTKCPMACHPRSGGRDRFRLTDKEVGSYICNQCGAGTGWALLQQYHNITYEEAKKMVIEHREGGQFTSYNYQPSEDEALTKNRAELKSMLDRIVPAKGTPAELYLQSRGLDLVDPFQYRGAEVQAFYLEDDVYWHDDGKKEILPSMIWKMWRGDGKPSGLHRTFITQQGVKADVKTKKKTTKRILTRKKMWEGGYLQIPLVRGENNILVIAEGIETTLSAWRMMKEVHMENCHAVALFNASGIEWFNPPIGQFHNMIFADKDDSRTGQLAAAACVKRLHAKHSINVFLPNVIGEDFNDVWQRNDKYEMTNILETPWL